MRHLNPPSDPYLIPALKFALEHKPCVIACTTIRAMEMTHLYLLNKGESAFLMKGSQSSEHKHMLMERFEEHDGPSFLVISASLLCMGGFRFYRPGVCLASTAYHSERTGIQLMSRINLSEPDPNRLFLRGMK